MANVPSNTGSQSMFSFSRTIVQSVNQEKVAVNYDFAFGSYLALKSFFEEMNSVFAGMSNGRGVVKLKTGAEIKTDSLGGLNALQLYLQQLDSVRQVMTGLSNLGLSVEKQAWKMS